ncbi:MAG TPA: methylmalonyl-CoA mutase family protein, partial [Thermoplasmata archaeon]|nr:methylmalonyl-CoA mutase family protein [Thermoplasmata archaeon]
VVGVNAFPDGNPSFTFFPDEPRKGRGRGLTISPELERAQKRDLAAWRAHRDQRKARGALDRLRRETDDGHNVMPPLLEAIRAGSTLGEVSDVWRDMFGLYKPSRTF